ncbi:aminotransferase [Radiomyces spectabilis]|uniref:aminotransferase n=1 Tax=Radiomyces spectabilis TaxID=64574 RepID=UPI0022204B11|nr:aminotransferase [Radiomyces spectabilis]KAI8368152.1 aminotransferase [Radiomyces spectabilis]
MNHDFSLLETILFTPQEGFYLLDLHITRLLKSATDYRALAADCFVSPPTPQQITDVLNAHLKDRSSYQRVRLLLNTASQLTVEATLLPEPTLSAENLHLAALKVPLINVILDTQPIPCITDFFLRHKTTRRDLYNNARERLNCSFHVSNDREPFDVVLWNQQHQVTETSIANIAVGEPINDTWNWKTPMTDCGLLGGVFRQYLLSTGEVKEAIITVDDLVHAQQKGHDHIMVTLRAQEQQQQQQEFDATVDEQQPVDEIQLYQDARYISAPKAIWRIYSFSLHHRSPAAMQLALHLPTAGKRSLTRMIP